MKYLRWKKLRIIMHSIVLIIRLKTITWNWRPKSKSRNKISQRSVVMNKTMKKWMDFINQSHSMQLVLGISSIYMIISL